MTTKPNYKNIHNRFRLDGVHYRFSDLSEVAYSLIKEGEDHERAIGDFLMDWIRPNDIISLKTSGSTGSPKWISYHKQSMVNSALATGDHFGLSIGDRALHCLNADFIAGKMMLVRAMILGLEIDLVPPQGNVLLHSDKTYDFAAMVPLQVANAFKELDRVKTLLIGGAPSSTKLKAELKNKKTVCFETYGMTETLTHIASRRINGGVNHFATLPNVKISQDERDCLVIEVPYLTEEKIITNDLVVLKDDSTFTLKGRVDNVINTGGVKVLPEEVEAKISAHMDLPFLVGSIDDSHLGQMIVLLIEGESADNLLEDLAKIEQMTKYEMPKQVFHLKEFIRTANGKVKRKDTFALLNL